MFLYGWDSLVIPAGFCFSAQERHEFSGFCPTRNRKKDVFKGRSAVPAFQLQKRKWKKL